MNTESQAQNLLNKLLESPENSSIEAAITELTEKCAPRIYKVITDELQKSYNGAASQSTNLQTALEKGTVDFQTLYQGVLKAATFYKFRD